MEGLRTHHQPGSQNLYSGPLSPSSRGPAGPFEGAGAAAEVAAAVAEEAAAAAAATAAAMPGRGGRPGRGRARRRDKGGRGEEVMEEGCRRREHGAGEVMGGKGET